MTFARQGRGFSRPGVAAGFGLLLLGAALSGSAAQAQSEVAEPVSFDGVTAHAKAYEKFSYLAITEVATEMGFKMSMLMAREGPPLVALADENGAQIIARPLMCTSDDFNGRCDALMMSVVLGGPSFPNINLPAMNAFNDGQFFARGHMAGEGRAVLSRLVVGEYGVTKGNLAIELYTFRSSAYNFARFLAAAQVSAALPDGEPGAALGALPGQGLIGAGAANAAGAAGAAGVTGAQGALPHRDLKALPGIAEVLEAQHLLGTFTNDAAAFGLDD